MRSLLKNCLFSILFLYPALSIATECNTKSPNFILEGDKYYSKLEAPKLTTKQKNEISKFFKGFKREMTGKAEFLYCKGPESTSEEKIEKELVKLKFSTLSNGVLKATQNIENKTRKTTRSDTHKYFDPKSSTFIHELSDTKIVISNRYRQKAASKLTILKEIITTFKKSRNKLTITTYQYINGYFSSRQTVNLPIK